MDRMPETVLLPQLYATPGSVHAARWRDLIYTAGLTARERDGSIRAKGDLAAQAEKVYGDLGLVLRAAAASWKDVVKVNYYVAPAACTTEGRKMLRSVESRHVPARSCAASGIAVEMDDAGLLIQIEAIACVGREKKVIDGIPKLPAVPGWAQAVLAGETLYAGAQLPFGASQVAPQKPISVAGDLGQQAFVAYGHFAPILDAAGLEWKDVMQVHQFLTPPRLNIDELQGARTRYLTVGQFLSTSVRSASEHPDWPMQDWLLSVDMEADARPRRKVQPKDTWGNPGGPHAFVTASLMRMHGQVSRSLERETIHEGDAGRQAEVVYRNIGQILKEAGSGWDRVLHIRNFCKRRDDVPTVRDVQKRAVGAARTTTTDIVADFFDPKLLLEVEVVAWTD